MGRWAVLLVLLPCACADDDPVAVLMRLRDLATGHGATIPNHTCVETVRRDRYQPPSAHAASCDTILARRKLPSFAQQLRLDSTDRLRLDVAMAAEREIYSWAGAGRFEEAEIDQWIPPGAIGTGPYASMLLSIFQNRGAKYDFEGDTTVEGRRLLEYSFEMPRESSHYRVKARREWVVTGYTGTLLVDPQTAELVRITVRTAELPPETGSCETDTTLEFSLVALGRWDYLLPKTAHQRFIARDGSEDENTLEFSSCREFHAESNIVFGEARGDVPANPAVPAGAAFPAGLPVTVRLVTPVDGGRAAAGDLIQGTLVKPIRDGSQKLLAPEGAPVEGRLMRVETQYGPPPRLAVALRWELLNVNGRQSPLSLVPKRRMEDARTGGRGLKGRGIEIELPLPGEDRYGVFHFPGLHAVMEGGFTSEWVTAKP